MRISTIIPVYNEEGNLAVIHQLLADSLVFDTLRMDG